MELKEAMNIRKTTRNFTGEPISEEQLNHILKAAWAAPVGGGRYNTVHMTIVKSPEALKKFNDNFHKFAPDTDPNYDVLYGAPLLIIFSIKDPGNEKVTSADPGFILENMSLAAAEEGVGQCVIYGGTVALDTNEELKRELGIPEGYTALGSMVLGQTNQAYAPRDIPDNRFAYNVVE